MPIWDSGRLRLTCNQDALRTVGSNPAIGSNFFIADKALANEQQDVRLTRSRTQLVVKPNIWVLGYRSGDND